VEEARQSAAVTGDPIGIALGASVFIISMVVYVRKRLQIKRLLRDGEPIAVEGWNTFPHEPEFDLIVKTQQNENFGKFCKACLAGLVFIGAAYGIEIRSDIFHFFLAGFR
jgi:hypothetical protein